MLEYIFFHNRPRKYFIRYLSNNGIRYNEKEDDHMGMVVAIPEDLDELILEEIEHHYDELMEDAEELLAEEEGDTGKQVAAITIDLDDEDADSPEGPFAYAVDFHSRYMLRSSRRPVPTQPRGFPWEWDSARFL